MQQERDRAGRLMTFALLAGTLGLAMEVFKIGSLSLLFLRISAGIPFAGMAHVPTTAFLLFEFLLLICGSVVNWRYDRRMQLVWMVFLLWVSISHLSANWIPDVYHVNDPVLWGDIGAGSMRSVVHWSNYLVSLAAFVALVALLRQETWAKWAWVALLLIVPAVYLIFFLPDSASQSAQLARRYLGPLAQLRHLIGTNIFWVRRILTLLTLAAALAYMIRSSQRPVVDEEPGEITTEELPAEP